MLLNLLGPTTDGGGAQTQFNGAALVFSVLQIQTRDEAGVVIAAPGALALFGLGLLGTGLGRRVGPRRAPARR